MHIWDLVCAWRMRKQLAIIVIYKMFGCDPSHPLNKSTHHLPHIKRVIHWPAQVHQYVNAPNLHFASVWVKLDFTCCDALREIQERIALALHFVKAKIWSCVIAIVTQGDPIAIRIADQFCKADRKNSARPISHGDMATSEFHALIIRSIWTDAIANNDLWHCAQTRRLRCPQFCWN